MVLQDAGSIVFSSESEPWAGAALTEEDKVGAAPKDEVGATRRSRSAHCLHQATKKVASDCSGAAVDY